MAENKEIVDKVTPEDAEEFIEFLVTFGGTVKVDPKTGEIRNHEDLPIEIDTSSGKCPMLVYRELSRTKNHLVLNPFSDMSTDAVQLNWFYNRKAMELAVLLQMIIESAIQFKSDKQSKTEDPNQFVKLEISSILKGDSKLLKEFQKIEPDDLLDIVYSKKKKTAQLQSNIFDPDYIKTLDMKATIISQFQKAFLYIFKVDSYEEFLSEYKFTSGMLTIPDAEAKLRVLHMGHKKLEKYYKAFFPDADTVDLKMFDKHLPNLHKYYGITSWTNSTAPVKQEVKTDKIATHVSRPVTDMQYHGVRTVADLIPTNPTTVIPTSPLSTGRPMSVVDYQRNRMGIISPVQVHQPSPYSIQMNPSSYLVG